MDSETIANFCAITDASDTTAEYFLSAAGGDLDMAIGLFYEHGGSTPAVSTSVAHEIEEIISIPRQNAPIIINDNDFESSEEDAGAVILTSTRRLSNTSSGGSEFEEATTTTTNTTTTTTTTRRLADLFRPPHGIMFNGTLEMARRQARDQRRWLLVTIHNPTDFASQAMNRDLWNSALLQGFIRENFIFVQMVAGGAEERRYTNFYPYDDLHPHVALIDPRTGERVETLLVASIAVPGFKLISSDRDMLELLGEFIAEHPMEPPVDRKRSSSSPKLEKEAQENENENENERESKKASIEATVVKSDSNDNTSDNNNNEDTSDIPVLPQMYEGADGIFIQFRLPDGQRHRHRFSPTSNLAQVFQAAAAASKNPAGSFKLRTAEGELKETDEIKNLHNTMLTIIK